MTNERRYEVQAVLGTGGFGTVYLARFVGQGGFAKQVAIKILHDKLDDVEEMARRLRDEARMLGLLEHRAIVRVDRLVQFGSKWAVVMEYVNGVDLSLLMGRGAVPVHHALEIIAEVAGALHAAYDSTGERGEPLRLVHRDIKPDNIFLTAGGSVKVLDFGIAWADFEEREADTQDHRFGSPRYMAPERFDQTRRRSDESSMDVYSLGVVLYELVLGNVFGRTSPIEERHNEFLDERLDKLTDADIPEAVIEFISHMVAYDPKDRLRSSEVERRALFLRSKLEGGMLRFWAQEVVPPLIRSGDVLPDGMDRILIDSRSVDTMAVRDTNTTTAFTLAQRGLKGIGWGGIALMVAAVIGVAGGSMFFYLTGSQPEAPMVAPEPAVPAVPVMDPLPDPPPIEEPEELVPVPIPIPTPTAPAPSETPEVSIDAPHGVVNVVGDADRVVLVGAIHRYGVPGRVPPGKYSVAAAFSGRPPKAAGALEVVDGETLTVRCDEMLETCLSH